MRILFLTQVLPYPLDAGPKIRAYYVLRYLARRHRVTLLSFVRESDPPDAIRHLERYCEAVEVVPIRRSALRDLWHLGRCLITREPFLIARDEVGAMSDRLRTLVRAQRFDAIHADQLWMAPYALEGRAAAPGPTRPRAILDQHNAVFQIPRRLAMGMTSAPRRALLRFEAHRMARFEPAICARFDRVVWVTDEDRRAVAAEAARIGVEAGDAAEPVIPICVDPETRVPITLDPAPRRVTFLGGLHWPPNAEGVRWFAREVWPLVRNRVPDARLTVIGRSPPAELAGIEGVELPGYVEEPRPLLEGSAAFVVPLHAGGGMRVKILDAWSWALPVLSTTIGAEGIATRDGENILIADRAPEFAAALERLLCDPALRARVAAGGRESVEQAYDWRRIYSAWEDVYQ